MPVAQDQRWALARHLLHDAALPVDRRVAALLVLLFAQPATRIAVLTTDHITITGDTVRLRLGDTPTDAPAPLDSLLRQLVDQGTPLGRVKTLGADPWLFPGRHPGRPADPHTLRRRVHAAGSGAGNFGAVEASEQPWHGQPASAEVSCRRCRRSG